MKRYPQREKAIGARIRLARLQCRMSQTALGEQLGLTFQQIQKYELGKDRVAASTLVEIAGALGQPIVFFVETPEDGDAPREPATRVADVRAAVRVGDALHRIADETVRRRMLALIKALSEPLEAGTAAPGLPEAA